MTIIYLRLRTCKDVVVMTHGFSGWGKKNVLVQIFNHCATPTPDIQFKVTWRVAKYGNPYSQFVLCINISKCTHTAGNSERTHTHTHGAVGIHLLWHPGSSWGFGVLLKGTSVVVLKVEESAVHSLPPPIIHVGTGSQTHNLQVTSPTL